MPFKSKESQKEYYRARDLLPKRKIMKQKWAEKNKERLKAKSRQYYLDHREDAIAKATIYYHKNRGKIRIYKAKWARLRHIKHIGLTNESYTKITQKCHICGFSDTVDLHHIDGDRKNINEDNLVGLCPNHHLVMHRLHLTYQELLTRYSK